MIKLFDCNDTVFNTSNGDMNITALKCNVKKGDIAKKEYYVDLETDIKYSDVLVQDKIILVETPKGEQPFRLNNPQKKSDRLIFKAYHIFYDTENYVIQDAYPQDKSCQGTLEWVINKTDSPCPFTAYSDLTGVRSNRYVNKSLFQVVCEIADEWGGKIEPDGMNIRIVSQIGEDRGVSIRYGKNLTYITAKEDWKDVCTKLYAVGYNGITLDSPIVSQLEYGRPYSKVVEFYPAADISLDDEAAIKEDLQIQAQAYLNENQYPKVSYKIKSHIDRIVDVGDEIEVQHEPLNIDIMTKVIAYIYNSLTKKFNEIEFGNYAQSVKSVFRDTSERIDNVEKNVSKSYNVLKQGLESSKNLINQYLCYGYRYSTESAEYYLNAKNPDDATQFMIVSLGGIGFGKKEVGEAITEAEYETAWTIDGSFNANFIKTGILNAQRIQVKGYDSNLEDILTGNDSPVIYMIDETPTMDNYPANNFFDDIFYPYEDGDPDGLYPGDWTWSYSNESYAAHFKNVAYNEETGEAFRFLLNDYGYGWEIINDKSELGYILSSVASISADIDSVNIQVEQTKVNLEDNYYTKTETEAKINVKSEAIQLAVDAEVERASGEEKKLAAALELKVDTDELVSQLNMSADEISIAGDRFSLDSTNTQIDTDGKITTKNIDVTGGNVNIDGSGNTQSTLIKRCKVTFSNEKYVEMSAYPYGGFVRCTDGNYRTFIDGTAIRLQSINSDGVFDTDSFISNSSTGTYMKVMDITADGDISSRKEITATGSIKSDDLIIAKGTGVSYINGYFAVGGGGFHGGYKLTAHGGAYIEGNLECTGTKNRLVDTQNYGQVLLNAYETPTPMFGDIGTAQLNENGECIIFVDDIFIETIDKATKYEVFLQKYGKGDIWVDEINDNYFITKGDAGLRFAWEIKGKQLNYSQYRLESEESNNFDAEYMQSDCVSIHDYEDDAEESTEQYETVKFDCEEIYDNVQFEDTEIYEF